MEKDLAPLPPPVLIFVRAQAAGNIGAMARAMSNFGCTELRLVGDGPLYNLDPEHEFSRMDWALSKKGQPILEAAKRYPTLREALDGLHLAIGTSGREVEFPLGYGRPRVDPHEAFGVVRDWEAKLDGEPVRWALVVGPEDDGLSTEESALCQKLVRIPTVDLNPSLNAAMAVGCLLYQWHLTNLGVAKASIQNDPGAFVPSEQAKRRSFREGRRTEWMTTTQAEDFLDYLVDTLKLSDFFKYPDEEAVRARFRRWLQAAPLPIGELLFAFEALYQLRAWGTGRFEKRNFLKRRDDDSSG